MRFTFYLFALIFLFGCSQSSDQNKSTDSNSSREEVQADSASETITEEVVILKDSVHDRIARFISGLPQNDPNSPYKKLDSSEYWLVHQASFESNWKKLKESRVNDMINWQRSYFQHQINDSLPMFYPFSGPDLLHALIFYPHAPSYTFFALENIYDVPDMLDMSKQEQIEALRGVEYALRDIFSKSYFITMHMGEDLNFKQINGVLPVFYAFLARTGHEILDVERVFIDTLGSVHIKNDSMPKNAIKGVNITFRKPMAKNVKQLYYWNVNIKNKNLEKQPEFEQMLTNLSPVNTFVKSASYVMHQNGFSTMKDITLAISQTIFQDDTGVRFEHFDKNKWDFKLFGEYTRPIKNFTARMYQEELKEYYDNTPADSIGHLPFFLGYHIVGDKIQNHMIAKKK